MYTSGPYRLLVYLYFPLLLAYPLLFDHHTAATVALGAAAFFALYELPDILEIALEPDTVLATINGSEVKLFLERDYKLDLANIKEIHLSTGFFPISQTKVEILQNDGITLSIKTRIQCNSLIKFLQNLRPTQTK